MSERGMENLHSLLFLGERELVNIKFFPGNDRGLTPGQLCEAAYKALSTALSSELVDNPPLSGLKATSFAEQDRVN